MRANARSPQIPVDARLAVGRPGGYLWVPGTGCTPPPYHPAQPWPCPGAAHWGPPSHRFSRRARPCSAESNSHQQVQSAGAIMQGEGEARRKAKGGQTRLKPAGKKARERGIPEATSKMAPMHMFAPRAAGPPGSRTGRTQRRATATPFIKGVPNRNPFGRRAAASEHQLHHRRHADGGRPRPPAALTC